MQIIYRSQKGSPLTIQEIDGNFQELETRIKALDEKVGKGSTESLAAVNCKGETLEFIGTQGTKFPSVKLPIMRWEAKGGWKKNAAYKAHDVVSYQQSLYLCMREHQSAVEFQTQNWQKILEIPKPEIQLDTLPFYSKQTLPKEVKLGALGLLEDQQGPKPIYFDGKQWCFVSDNQPTIN